jgi:hypothetical protein
MQITKMDTNIQPLLINQIALLPINKVYKVA